MELRPRRGRSAQPPSTPTVAKPSPRPPPQSSSRKKPPPTPILIQDANLKEIHPDLVDAAPKETHMDLVAAAPIENGDQSSLTQDNQDIILPDSFEFETPVSSIVKLRRAQKKLASSGVKSKIKVTSSVKKKKMVEELGSTPVADTCIEGEGEARVTAASEKVGLGEATTKKAFGAPNGEDALEEMEKQEFLAGSVPQNSNELAVEITVAEVCSKRTEVLSPSSKSKKLHSSKKKSAKKRDEDNEVVDAKLDQVDVQQHLVDVDAPIVSESQALSLILSDDETAQLSNAAQVEGCAETETFSTREEEILEKCWTVAEVSKARSTGKKSQSNKKGSTKEDNLSRKLFEETSDITAPTDTEAKDQIRNRLGWMANPSKESASKIDPVEVEKCAERVSSSRIMHNFKSPSRSLKEREVADLEMLDSDGDKPDTSDPGVEGKDIVNDRVQEVSEESSDEAISSRDEDVSNDHDKLDAATFSSQKNYVHVEECCSSDDDGGNASSGSDDDDEDEMASAFFSSMKAHLQRISDPSCSVLSTQKGMQAKQEALGRTDSQLTKSTVKEPCANGRSTGHGLSWCPEVVLSASKTSKAQAGKPRSVGEASPNTIWGRDRCLQDSLCVPPVDPLKLNKLARKQKDNTAGAKWFNMYAPTITPELKKELQLLKLRGALDPKRHYKAEDSKGLPKFFQVGTVVGGPADFYSGRLTKKEQKNSLASELLSDSSLTAYRKRKYTEIQDQKQAGGKGFWKKKKSKRTPAWAKI